MKTVLALIVMCGLALAAGTQDCPVFRPGQSPQHDRDLDFWTGMAPANGPSTGAGQPHIYNPVDRYIFARLDQMGVKPAFVSSDSEFIRRVTLDLTGRIPAGDRVIQFLADDATDKRQRLVDELIASEAFTDKWTFWFDELLGNTSNHGGVTVAGRNLMHAQLRNAIRSNIPYNRLVTDLITAKGTITENGFVNFIARRTSAFEPIQDTWDDLAADSGRIFLGLPMLCVSCHNGAGHLEQVNEYLSTRTREEFWAQAAFFSRINIERTMDGSVSKPFRFSDAETGNYDSDTAANPGMRPLRSGGPYTPAFFLTG